MPGCAAVNCSNSSEKGYRLFRFPADPERKKQWIINCRRDRWTPTANSRLCEVHFENSQFEAHRQDNWRKLKQTAVPTLFNVPNPPPTLQGRRIKGVGIPKSGSILHPRVETIDVDENVAQLDQQALINENEILRKRVKELEEKLKASEARFLAFESKVKSFLTEEQIKYLGENRNAIAKWSKDNLVKGLKLRFALGKHGYEYLRSTGDPAPAYSTLNRRTQSLQFDFGILHNIAALLKTKISCMNTLDKICCLSIDEMEITSGPDFDTSSKSFLGEATMGREVIANHYLVVLLRGLKSPWKQVIAHELTGPSTTGEAMFSLLSSVIAVVQNLGLKVAATVSDMGSSNTALWKKAGVSVTRNNRQTSSVINGEAVNFLADVPHLIKNVRSAFLRQAIILPIKFCEENDLPSRFISSGHIKHLWMEELKSNSGLYSLYHLKKCHLFPTHFGRMNVALAVQLFSLKTAAALEKAVALKQLPRDALTTAWFIRIMNQWFTLVTARHRIVGITVRNKQRQFDFLNYVVDLFQESDFGGSWKPVQTGVILTSLSIINISSYLFTEGFSFFLPGRLTQDALENVFSQVRRKAGSKPTAVQVKSAIKLICMSQFISDVKNSNYASESDYHLFDDFSTQTSVLPIPQKQNNISTEENTAIPSTSQNSETQNIIKVIAEENDIYYIAGSAVNAIAKRQSVCNACKDAMAVCIDSNEPEVPQRRQHLTSYSDMGGLRFATSGIYRICRETERLLQSEKAKLLSGKISINDVFIQKVKRNCTAVELPSCCLLKERLISYYATVRCIGIKNHLQKRKSQESHYGSKSMNKKQKKDG